MLNLERARRASLDSGLGSCAVLSTNSHSSVLYIESGQKDHARYRDCTLTRRPLPPRASGSPTALAIDVKNAKSTDVSVFETLFERPKPGVSPFETPFQTQKHRFKCRPTPCSSNCSTPMPLAGDAEAIVFERPEPGVSAFETPLQTPFSTVFVELLGSCAPGRGRGSHRVRRLHRAVCRVPARLLRPPVPSPVTSFI